MTDTPSKSDPVLAMDTSMGACSVALSIGGAVAASRHAVCRSGHSERLMDMAAEVLAEAGLGYGDIGRFAVTVGPGSFTGVRIGLAAARALGLAANRPVSGVSTLEALAAGAARHHGLAAGTRLQVVVDARRGEAYVQDFEVGTDWAHPKALEAPAVRPLASLPGPPAPDVRIGSAARLLEDDGTPILESADAPDARIVALMAEQAALPSPYAPPVPLYLRAPDAKLPAGAPAP